MSSDFRKNGTTKGILMKNLKQKLKAGETLTGCWLNLGSPITAEIVGMAGFHWVLIDLEHGAVPNVMCCSSCKPWNIPRRRRSCGQKHRTSQAST